MARATLSPLIKAQVEKLTAGGGGGIASGHRPISSSSPIIVPKKPTRSNTSSQSSSSYTSITDQMPSLGETLLQSRREPDDALNTSLPTLSSTCQRLEHSAARDRISVKNKRRQQPIKEKLSILRETDDLTFDKQFDLFSSTPDEEQSLVLPQIESKIQQQQQQQPLINLSDLDTARARLRLRDRSADNILLKTPLVPTSVSLVHRSQSFKRPEEINETKYISRSIYQIKKHQQEEENPNDNIDEQTNVNNSSSIHSASQEHIYDNLDLFKRYKTTITSDILSNDNESSTNLIVQTREQFPPTATRFRPVTMHIPTINDKSSINEFENVFNQLKKRSSIKKVPSNEEKIPVPPPEEPSFDEVPISLPTENEPIVISTKATIEIAPVSQSPNRRKTVSGVNLPVNNKIAVDDHKPTASWIDIAKQKQNKFQSVADEKNETEQQTFVSRKQVTILSNSTSTRETSSMDTRSNRKSMFEPVIARRVSPPISQTNTHIIERDSIRALKAGNANRINNLIQFFDK